MAELNKKKATNVSKIVDLRKLPKVPRDPRMMANNGGVPLGRNRETGVIRRPASTLTWTSGSKTKLTDGKSVLTRARREAKELSQMAKLSRPTHQLTGGIGQVKQAPVGMVNEYRRDRLPAHAPVKILSKKKSVPGQFEGSLGGLSLEEREKRLLALTKSKGQMYGAVEATLVSSEDDEGDDLDDLFDEKPTQSSRATSSISSLSQHSSQTPTIRSQPHQQPTPSPSSSASPSRPAPSPKPSDLISSIVSKPKPRPLQYTSTPLRPGTPTTFLPSPSPGHSEPKRMIIKKRPPPDIFNRAPKKPRAR
jgi:elongin-A